MYAAPLGAVFNQVVNNPQHFVGGALSQQLEQTNTQVKSIPHRARDYLHNHFDVSHQYVIRKLTLLLFPYVELLRSIPHARDSASFSLDSNPTIGRSDRRRRYDSDVQRSDLYIPTMAFITYVILFAWFKGIKRSFTPTLLSERTTIGLAVLMGEAILCFGATVLWCPNSSFLDTLSTLGYKFVYLALIVGLGVCLGRDKIYLIGSIYLIACSVMATFLLLTRLQLGNHDEDDRTWMKRKSSVVYVALSFAVLQIALCYFLAP